VSKIIDLKMLSDRNKPKSMKNAKNIDKTNIM